MEKRSYLTTFTYKEEYRGKGYGREAMGFIETYAKGNNYKRLQFQSETTNSHAKGFYETLGFNSVNMHFYVKYF